MGEITVQGSELGNALTEMLMAPEIIPGDGVFYVYALFRPDGRPCYVGKGRGRRWLQHERMPNHYNRHLASIIRLAGGTLPKAKIIEGLTDQQASEAERRLIARLGRYPAGPLVNLTDGGDGKKGYVAPPETCAKISQSNTGKTRSLESRRRQSLSVSGRPKTKAHSAAVGAALKGKPKSEATKRAMAAAAAKRWARSGSRDGLKAYHAMFTPEQKAMRSEKIRAATIAAMRSPDIRAKISAARSR